MPPAKVASGAVVVVGGIVVVAGMVLAPPVAEGVPPDAVAVVAAR